MSRTSSLSSIRPLIVSLGFGIGFWVLASFTGAMLDPMRAEPWTTSLMFSLLASAVIAPALLMAYHNARRTPTRQKTSSQNASFGRSAASDEAKPFVETAPSIAEPSAAKTPAAKTSATNASATEPSTDRPQATLWPEPQDPDYGPMSEEGPTSEETGEWPQVSSDRRRVIAN